MPLGCNKAMGEAGREKRETHLGRYWWPDDKVLVSYVKKLERMRESLRGFKIAE